MSEMPNFTPEFDAESLSGDSETKNSKEKKKKSSTDSRKIAASVLKSEPSTEKAPEERSNQEQLKRPAESIIDKLVGKESRDEERPAAAEHPAEATQLAEEASVESAVAAEEVSTEEAEHSVAEDLHNGTEISLREISEIPPEHDENVVQEALELPTPNEEVPPEAPLEEEATEGPELALADQVPLPAATPEAVEQNSREQPDAAPETSPTPPTPPVRPMPIIHSPRTRFRRPNPYGNPLATPGGSGNGGGGSIPLATPGYGGPFNQGPNAGPNYNTANTAHSTAPNARDIENATWESFQDGRRKGMLAGLLVGGGIEHFRHKRREKRMEKIQRKEIGAQQKRVERLERDYAIARQNQQSKEVRSERILAKEGLARTAEQVVPQASAGESLSKPPEHLPSPERLIKKADEVRQPAEEILAAVPKGHHIERSAWHNIEVDERGKAVQDSAIEYGHEYYKERAFEAAPKQQVDSAAGEVALVAAALSETGGQKTVQVPAQLPTTSLPVPPARRPLQSSLSRLQPEALRDTAETILKTITTPPSTPFATAVWLGVLIIIAIAVFAIAR